MPSGCSPGEGGEQQSYPDGRVRSRSCVLESVSAATRGKPTSWTETATRGVLSPGGLCGLATTPSNRWPDDALATVASFRAAPEYKRGEMMSETAQHDATTGVADNFTSTAKDYDAGVRHNINGAARLIASLPAGDYPRVLDIGCGTGWASFAMLDRFRVEHITGVDPAAGMLEVFREKATGVSGVEVDLLAEDVMAMSVTPGSYDAVISSMAMHWFPDKPAATVKMAETLKPGGVIAILCSGRGGEHEFRAVLAGLDDPPAPPAWDAAFDAVQRDVDELETYLVAAGLEPIDIWMERRLRHTTPEAYLERMRVVASHITAGDLDEAEVASLMEQVGAGMAAVSGPRGFAYSFTKLYAVARKPA